MNKIKDLRKKFGISARQLAEAVGTSRSNISMIEINLRKPDLNLAKRIAEYFGTTIEDIFFVDHCHITGQTKDNSQYTGTEGKQICQ